MNDVQRLSLTQPTGPNEQRTISREDLGLYHAVTIGAIYRFPSTFDIESAASYFGPLAACLAEDPYLSVIVGGSSDDKSWYKRTPSVDLARHLDILHQTIYPHDRIPAIQQLLAKALDRPFEKSIPAWRLVVLPLGQSRAFLAFAFSHTLGDGNVGCMRLRSKAT